MNEIEREIIGTLEKNNLLQSRDIHEDNYLQIISQLSIQMDSFMYISLLVELEDKYNIELDTDTLAGNVFENIHNLSLNIMDMIQINYNKKEVLLNEKNP